MTDQNMTDQTQEQEKEQKQEQGQEQQSREPVLIDINAPLEVKVKIQGGQVHRLKYPNDGQLLLFERKRKGTFEENIKSGTGKAKNPVIEAHLWFYNLLTIRVTDREGKEIKKEKISPMVKHTVADMLWKNTVLTEAEVVGIYGQDKIAEPDEAPEGQVIYLQVHHNGKWHLTRHVLNYPSENDYINFKSLGQVEKQRKNDKMVFSSGDTSKEKIDIYNRLFIGSYGYTNNTISGIPGTHKLEVVEHIFKLSQDEIIEIEGN